MNYNLAFCKGTFKSERWGCQPHVKWSRSLYPNISPLLVSKTREMTRKLWFPLSAKGSSWFDNVFKPVHPELPRGWTLPQLPLLWTLSIVYGGSGLACSWMRMACALTINPTTRMAAGLPFLCPAFYSDMQTTHRPILSQHPNLLFLPQTSAGTYLNAGCLCPHLSWLSAKGKEESCEN